MGLLPWRRENSTCPHRGETPDRTSPLCPDVEIRARRLFALNSPRETLRLVICWDFNSHHGCRKYTCAHFDNGGKQIFRNYDSLTAPRKIYLVKHGGFEGHKKLEISDIPLEIRTPREDFKMAKMRSGNRKCPRKEQIKAPSWIPKERVV